MKSFTEFQEEQELDEGIIRSGSVATFAARSATAGKKAEKAYRKGLLALNDASNGDELDRISAALKAILAGHMHQAKQISNHVTLDTIGHLSNGKNKLRR